MKKLSEIKKDFMELSLPMGLIIVAATPKLDILFANEMFVEMMGFDDQEEFISAYNASAWNFIYDEDVERLKKSASIRIGKLEPYEISYRAIKKDKGLIWVNQNSRHTYDENKNEIIFAYYTDITAKKKMEAEVIEGTRKYETLINSIPGGVGMYQLNDDFSPIFISDRVYELCGMTKEEYCTATCKSTLDVFHPDDRQGLIDATKRAYSEKRKLEYTHRVLQKNGEYRWLRVSGQIVDGKDGIPILYTVFTDTNEQFKAEQALRESEFRYKAAIRSSNINIWEYDYDADSMTIFYTSSRVRPQCNVIQNYMQTVVQLGHIRQDSAKLLFSMVDKLKNGEKETTADLWIREGMDEDFWCERVIYTNIFSDGGKPVKAYCVGHDVTKEKEAEKRYNDELYYRKAMQKATMASINVNLSKNIILDYKSNFSEVALHMRQANTVQEYFDKVYTELVTSEMQQQCASVFNRDALLRSFANGKTTLSMELTRRIEGRRYWTVMTAHMMKRHEDNEIVAFLYSTNITNERTMQNIMNAIVKTDYDFLVVVDAIRNSAVRYSEKDLGVSYAYESENFEEETIAYARKNICAEDVERVIKEISLDNILKELKVNGTYNIFYKVPNSDGKISQKQLRFCYINSEMKSFLMTRTDITAAVEKQEKKNKELVEAVAMAEHANAAKSEFLSHISHEIRTPMNAIIGMSEIALQSVDDKVQTKESIEKSLYASKYLLLLLNDILDMSRIESGKITLKNEIIVCRHFLDAIDTIINEQAKAKGVKYLVTEFQEHKSCYNGDGVRLLQILINILSNAVKFTPKGGTVQLDITQISADAKRANLCFRISDTGIGISEAFLPNLFKPFSQENNGSASGYGGSGLGLAISKNLAQLMGGDIFVQSIHGKGTVFTVNIPLGISNNEANIFNNKQYLNHLPQNYSFINKRFLLVEDHRLNIMVAKKLLEFKGATVDTAENGEIALTMFTHGDEHLYDAILMDIRMPIMDGLQASRAIRCLDSPWAKKVPIIAMSANAFDEDVAKSKEAGMNAHLAKPIDSALLYRTIYEFLKKEEDETIE